MRLKGPEAPKTESDIAEERHSKKIGIRRKKRERAERRLDRRKRRRERRERAIGGERKKREAGGPCELDENDDDEYSYYTTEEDEDLDEGDEIRVESTRDIPRAAKQDEASSKK